MVQDMQNKLKRYSGGSTVTNATVWQALQEGTACRRPRIGDRHQLTQVPKLIVQALWLQGACRDAAGRPLLGPDGRLMCAVGSDEDELIAVSKNIETDYKQEQEKEYGRLQQEISKINRQLLQDQGLNLLQKKEKIIDEVSAFLKFRFQQRASGNETPTSASAQFHDAEEGPSPQPPSAPKSSVAQTTQQPSSRSLAKLDKALIDHMMKGRPPPKSSEAAPNVAPKVVGASRSIARQAQDYDYLVNHTNKESIDFMHIPVPP